MQTHVETLAEEIAGQEVTIAYHKMQWWRKQRWYFNPSTNWDNWHHAFTVALAYKRHLMGLLRVRRAIKIQRMLEAEQLCECRGFGYSAHQVNGTVIEHIKCGCRR